jgi:hypothetical protein
MTVTAVAPTSEINKRVEVVGRVAIAAQGVLYAVVGLLAAQLAGGDRGAKPSQHGAIETVARQPFGRVLLIVLATGLAAHALWRGTLAVRGEPGDDEDGKSVAKRLANAARSALYLSFLFAALKVLARAGGAESGGREKEGTAQVLGWPGGTAIVVGVGLAIIVAGLWNAKRGVTRSFEDKLDLHELDEAKRRTVVATGVAGYLARGAAYLIVGWFLVDAGLQHDASETRGLDDALHEFATTAYGPPALFVLAVGMVLFGAFRLLDGAYRRPSEITHA